MWWGGVDCSNKWNQAELKMRKAACSLGLRQAARASESKKRKRRMHWKNGVPTKDLVAWIVK